MDTGYYLVHETSQDIDQIFGPAGYTGYWVARDGQRSIYGLAGWTEHWIFDNNVYSKRANYTGFNIQGNRIIGPHASMPWA